MIRQFFFAAALIAASATTSAANDDFGDKLRVTLVYDQVLPNVPGKSIRGVLVEKTKARPKSLSDAPTTSATPAMLNPDRIAL